MSNHRKWILWFVTCGFLGGCSLLQVKQQSEEINSSTVLVGWISTQTPWSGPIVAAAYQAKSGQVKAADCTWLHESGGYELIVPNGRYELVAFGDANGNLRLDADEPFGVYRGSRPVLAEGTGVVAQLDIELKRTDTLQSDVWDAVFADCDIKRLHSTQVGAIADLDDPLFSQEYGHQGYWAPMEFFREVGGNIYFLEPYDPDKIPILFVHGAAGSPQNWRYFFEHIDRDRYQPWFFYYPSGARIDAMAHLLSWKLFTLQLKYRYKKMYIVAHSMGGLVVRSLLLDHGQAVPDVKLFVSLATPWGGEPSAEMGVKYSPGVVPSWIDMQPQGEYMQSLFARKLPGELDYYLLFGYQGGSNLLRPNNDRTIVLTSALRMAAQAEAKQVYGFDEDHVSILSSPQVLAQFTAILDNRVGDSERLKGPRAGRLRVTSSYPKLGPGAPPVEALCLVPRDSAREAIILPLSRAEEGREVGPIPPGEYTASLLVQGFATTPRRVPVTITPGETVEASFKMSVQGVLLGYVGVGNGAAKLHAGAYVPRGESLKIDSITLHGRGVDRQLVPKEMNDREKIDRFLAQQDYAADGEFIFFNLPAGEYELSVTAEGYLPNSGHYTVRPGQRGQWRPVMLQPVQ